MRKVMQVLIVLFGLLVVIGGCYIAFAILDTDNIIRKLIPAAETVRQGIGEALQSYSADESRLRQKYPVAEPTSWSNLITDAVSKAGLTMRRISIKPPQPLKGSTAQVLIGNIDISTPQLADVFKAASNIEKIHPAVVISRFEIQPRSTDDAPYTCSIEVTIYEQAGGVAQPTNTPEESAAPSGNPPQPVQSVPPPPQPTQFRPPVHPSFAPPISGAPGKPVTPFPAKPSEQPAGNPPGASVPLVTPPHTGL